MCSRENWFPLSHLRFAQYLEVSDLSVCLPQDKILHCHCHLGCSKGFLMVFSHASVTAQVNKEASVHPAMLVGAPWSF